MALTERDWSPLRSEIAVFFLLLLLVLVDYLHGCEAVGARNFPVYAPRVCNEFQSGPLANRPLAGDCVPGDCGLDNE